MPLTHSSPPHPASSIGIGLDHGAISSSAAFACIVLSQFLGACSSNSSSGSTATADVGVTHTRPNTAPIDSTDARGGATTIAGTRTEDPDPAQASGGTTNDSRRSASSLAGGNLSGTATIGFGRSEGSSITPNPSGLGGASAGATTALGGASSTQTAPNTMTAGQGITTTTLGGTSARANAPSRLPANPRPTVETESFALTSNTTDIADDCAIYANPDKPELSVVVADNKDTNAGGVGVFDMNGKLLQFREEGTIGNIDLRSGFLFGSTRIVLVGANARTSSTLAFWQLDPSTRQLSARIDDGTRTVSPNYGFCLYHSRTSDKFYAFVTQEIGASVMEQYELQVRNGKVSATRVRSFEVGSITEGCVADDELGILYVAQEDKALWRYGAEPTAGTDRTAVATVDDGNVVADLEGLSLANGQDGSGYLVLSIQSESRFVMYDRQSNLYLGGFAVGSSGDIDAVSQTDGLDISTANLGPGFEKGALVVHDGSNSGGETSNLKFIPLE